VEESEAVPHQHVEHKPKFWSPPLAIALTVLIYFVAQLIAGLVIALYPLVLGLSSEETTLALDKPIIRFAVIALFGVAVITIVAALQRFKKLSLKSIGLMWPTLKDVAYAALGFVVYFALFIGVAVVARLLFPGLNFDQKQQIGFHQTSHSLTLVIIFLSLVVIPPITEEILMRGFLYTSLKSEWPVWLAAIVTSVMFAAAHLQFGSNAPLLWVAAIDTFSLSLVLIYLRQKTGSLGAPMLLHGLKNAIAFFFLFVVRL
jgi:membrane protease YdiL (CAAX protease family)